MLLVELAHPALSKEFPPGLLKESEELLVHLDVVSIAFSLIPDNPADRQMTERSNGSLKEIGWVVGMTLQRIVGRGFFIESVGDVLAHSSASPSLSEVAVTPVVEDVWELPFQRRAVNPRLSCRASDGVTDNADWHILEAIT